MQASIPGMLAEDSRVRPLWLVTTLSLLTLGTYSIVWVGLAWTDLRAFGRRTELPPALEAVLATVPVVGAIRAYRYFSTAARVQADLGYGDQRPSTPSLGLGIGNAVAWWALFGDGSTRAMLWIVAMALITVTIVRAQASLNRCWYAAIGRYADDHVTALEWTMLVVGVLFAPLFVLGALASR